MNRIKAEVAELQRPVSVTQIAALLKMSRWGALRMLLAMHDEDRKLGRDGWMWSGGPRAKTRVSLSQLRIVHPELFGRRTDIRGELTEIVNEIRALTASVGDVRKQINAQGARIRDLEKQGRSGAV